MLLLEHAIRPTFQHITQIDKATLTGASIHWALPVRI
jgi:hypothetical protein